MGRITEAISFINKENAPTPLETKHFYTHIDREELMKLRKKYRKGLNSEDIRIY